VSQADPRQDALRVVRLLLDPEAEWPSTPATEWGALAELARRNGVLVRLALRLETVGIRPLRPFAEAAERERARAAGLAATIHRIGEVCAAEGIEFLFPKAFQHSPDMGSDIDLLVLSRSATDDAALVRALGAASIRVSLRERIAGTATYALDGGRAVLDIRHHRLGQLGEHRAYPARLVRDRRRIVVEGRECFAPSREDRLVLQGVERLCGRRSLRISDLVSTVATIRGGVDWDRVIGTAREIGVLHGLGGYLSYVDQLHRAVSGSGLLEPGPGRSLPLAGWGRLEFRDGYYRFPTLRASARIYARKLGADLAAANWESAGRLCLLPVVAAAAILHPRRLSAGASPPT